MKQAWRTVVLGLALGGPSWAQGGEGAEVLGPPVPARLEPQAAGGLLPFRSPDQDVEVPRDLWRDLEVMLQRIESGGAETYFDAEGREVSDDPVWQRKRQEAAGKMFNMAAMFGIVLRDSRNVRDRELAAYGTFLVDDVQDVMKLIAFFPGEPERHIRQEAMRRAVEFLRVHLPEDVVEDGTSRPRYTLEAGGYVALLDVADPRDQAQGLWFLAQLAEIREDVAPALLEAVRDRLPELLTAEHGDVREQARAFVLAVDPAQREPPAPDAAREDVLAWLREVLVEVLPPIRRVSQGRVDLYPSEQVDRLVEVGRDVLVRGAIGESAQGTLQGGRFFRGFRIARVPEPLERLHLPAGAVVVRINGQPVATSQEVLDAIEAWLERGPVLIVEYVDGGQERVMEYRLRSS